MVEFITHVEPNYRTAKGQRGQSGGALLLTVCRGRWWQSKDEYRTLDDMRGGEGQAVR